MTVWLENPFDNLPGEGSRPQRYQLMAEAFARAGHRVVLWTSDWSHARKVRRTLSAEVPFEVRLVPTRPYRANVSLARVLSHRAYARKWLALALAEAKSSRPDLLVVSAPPLSTGRTARMLKRRFGCRLVVDIQDAWPETFYRLLPRILRPSGRLLFSAAHRAARRLYREADALTGVCDRYAELASAAGARIYRRFYLGIALGDFPASPLRQASPPCLLYLGSLGRTYDLSTVLSALSLLPDATLDIAGEGEQEAFLRREVQERGLGDRIRFHGFLKGADLAALAASCTIGLVPMKDDSFVGIPNKFADYSAFGLSLVSSLGGESADLLKRFDAGATYRPGDVASLVEAIRHLPSNAGAFARRMAENVFEARAIYDAFADFAVKEA